jgi:hypothetical protein
VKLAEVEVVVPDGPERMLVVGGTVSTVKDLLAGDWSVVGNGGELSTARTWNVWGPSERLKYWAGVVQAPNDNPPPSMSHSKLSPVGLVNSKVTSLVFMRLPSAGPDAIVVSGSIRPA